MTAGFRKRIAPFVGHELVKARQARSEGERELEFTHLERAHVLGQASTYWHVKVHVLMLMWALRQRDLREFLGQVFRTLGAALGTALGMVPQGNTGGANVSPFRKMPIDPELQGLIERAKADV
ncbi:MAG: DUF3703 domain-containing protein [Marinobacter sp.]|uniref:DUF3703 domain-containing protein n=1 Tax=Marinobacter sp. TaxID=50741 RepID=UPI00299CD67B|nr:DUF3703 domain-containing protein [Marinobacter sp.]MDX1636255.1 DUF3703 domain-containing protein [Marinobacter sp.]